MADSKTFFSESEKQQIVNAIAEAEKNTSGEIRVHIEDFCKGEVLEIAIETFAKLKMHETQLRNGVLIYLSVKDRKFAIYGDSGINKIVPEIFWDEIKNQMQEKYKEGKFSEGLCNAILSVGAQLKANFPYSSDDKNELSNDLTFKNND